MSKRPNILFVITDHTNARAVADPRCLTPNLDRLAADGVRFDRYYTTNAICSPARASLMTGLFPSTHGVWDCTHTQRPEWVDIAASRCPFFSRHLARAGYRNAYFGKWHVEQSNRLEDFGWHEFDLRCGNGRGRALPGTELSLAHPGYRDYPLAAVSDGPETHPAFDRAIDFLHRRQGCRDPFCCVVSTTEPHDAYVPPRRFYERYDPDSIELPASLLDDLEGKPDVVRRLRAVWDSLGASDWQRITASYWAVITFLDHEFGRLLQALTETGMEQDTIVVFTADHGDMMGAHGLLTKGIGTPYEQVYNIPLIMRVPGAAVAGPDARHVLSTVDIAPTLLDLCDAEALPDVQGRSFRDILAGTASADDWQDAYAEFFGQRFVYTQRLVWHRNWKYVFSPGGIDELYDLETDPEECHNLAARPEHRSTLIRMTQRMWRRMRVIGDDSLFNTHYGTLRTAPIGPLSIIPESEE